MTTEEDYGFDVAGFLHVPHVLSTTEVAACIKAIDAVGRDEGMLQWPAPWCDAFRLLHEHPVLRRYLEALCGAGFVMDRPASMIAPGADNTGVPLSAGDPDCKRRLRYVAQRNSRICHGVRIVWALAPTTAEQGGLVLVPASHKRCVEPPADFLRGADDQGMTVEPRLEAGDLLLCAATTLHGVRGRPGRLVQSQYISARAMPSEDFDPVPPPQWTTELTPEQLAVVGPRTTGRGSAVFSDGEQKWTGQAEPLEESITDILRDDFAPDPKELWFWDVRGYLVIRGIVNEAWRTEAHKAIDATIAAQSNLPTDHPSAFEEVPEAILRENNWKWPEDTSPRIRGNINRPRIGGLYRLPAPYCEPFRKMIAHPPVIQRLNWMLGYGYKEVNEPMCCIYPRGTTGGSLHAGGGYTMINGRPHVDAVNVAWALHDEPPGFGEDSGGFVCVPGSHKMSYKIPPPQTTNIDLPQVYKPALQAGDVLIFGGVTHGTTAWRSPWDRRTVIQFMCSRHVSVRPASPVVGWRWSTDKTNPTNTLPASWQRTV